MILKIIDLLIETFNTLIIHLHLNYLFHMFVSFDGAFAMIINSSTVLFCGKELETSVIATVLK